MGKRANRTGEPLSIGGNLRRYRLAEGLTLKQLAARSGVSIATISKVENGKISGGFETIYKIARGLGVLVTDIIVDGASDEEPLVVHRRDRGDVHRTAPCLHAAATHTASVSGGGGLADT